jgi:chromosome segregation ATPase
MKAAKSLHSSVTDSSQKLQKIIHAPNNLVNHLTNETIEELEAKVKLISGELGELISNALLERQEKTRLTDAKHEDKFSMLIDKMKASRERLNRISNNARNSQAQLSEVKSALKEAEKTIVELKRFLLK